MLHRDGAHLTTVDCFEFLLRLPREAILVGFSIGYDATQWMRGIMGDAMERILNPKPGRHGPLPVYWRDYAIIWQPGQYFSVARLYPDRNLPSGSHRRRKVIPGSTRTINEVFGFFQNSFINTIETWNIGDQKIREFIVQNEGQAQEIQETHTQNHRVLRLSRAVNRRTAPGLSEV
jgi:hypothetical protein